MKVHLVMLIKETHTFDMVAKTIESCMPLFTDYIILVTSTLIDKVELFQYILSKNKIGSIYSSKWVNEQEHMHHLEQKLEQKNVNRCLYISPGQVVYNHDSTQPLSSDNIAKLSELINTTSVSVKVTSPINTSTQLFLKNLETKLNTTFDGVYIQSDEKPIIGRNQTTTLFKQEDTIFDKATCYQSAGDLEKATELYTQVVNDEKSSTDEKYVSYLRLGRMLHDRKQREALFMKGIQLNNKRLECWYEMVYTSHCHGDNRSAAMYGILAGTDRTYTENDFMIEKDIYDTHFDLYFSLACYYAGLYKEGYDAVKRALTTTTGTQNLSLLRSNIEWFEPHIQSQVHIPIVNNQLNSQVIIVNDFYKNPDNIRQNALSMKFDVKGNYPGYRTAPHIEPGTKELFESAIGKKITYWPGGYNGSFQYTTSDMKSWIHRDNTEWSAIIYLTPDAPVDSGTIMYRHKPTGMEYVNMPDEEHKLGQDTYDDSKWEVTDRVANIYNRCVLFKGRRSHMAGPYFGTTKENARLFQTFFFNV